MLISSIIVAACMERQLGDPYSNNYAKNLKILTYIFVASISSHCMIILVSLAIIIPLYHKYCK